MRILILALTICTVTCNAQRPDDGVLAVYRQMEKAEQTGNGQAWIDLWSPRAFVGDVSGMKDRIRPRPSVRYGVTKMLVQGDMAALVGTMDDQFLSMRFVRENGAWKILDQSGSNVPLDPASLYVLLPPADGAFGRAGSPWDNVLRATMNAKYYRPEELRWKLQGTYDESFLYLRIEAASALPPPNTEVKGTFPNLRSGVPRDWPVMKIHMAGPPSREYTFDVADFVGDQATFGGDGKATTHRHFVSYSVSVRRGDNEVYSASVAEKTDPLIAVTDRFIDVRFPLKALGIDPPVRTKIEIADANSVNKFVPYEVKGFVR